MLKYLVIPGTVRSRMDGDEHYIGSRQLMDLYQVDPRECVRSDVAGPFVNWHKGLVKLRPRACGRYVVPLR